MNNSMLSNPQMTLRTNQQPVPNCLWSLVCVEAVDNQDPWKLRSKLLPFLITGQISPN